MEIRYRYVPYGTRFEPHSGARTSAHADPLEWLFENEIATDVGQRFWPANPDGRSAPLAIIDHHFAAAGQFPSASAAVLHSVGAVSGWWDKCSIAGFEEIFLITHQGPDFDALASLYLLESFAEPGPFDPLELGLAPDGWRDLTPAEHTSRRQRFDWLQSPPALLDPDVRWRLAIGVAASMTDQCRRFDCAPVQSPPAIFYAAQHRRQPFTEMDAAMFFSEFRDAVVSGKNPVTDPLFANSVEFAPELQLLAGEDEKYERDRARARRIIVAVASCADFEEYHQARVATPLFRAPGEIDPIHLNGTRPLAADGIFIRDPEAVLFKDLARMDYEHSSIGLGFLFTAVAYSKRKPDRIENHSDYYFALDPEHAGSLTLYPLWALLQAAEIGAITETARQERINLAPRDGYAERADGFKGLFSDPWFDGPNFRRSLVVAPAKGTFIGPSGTALDLSDDPVAGIVRELLHNVFTAQPGCLDFVDGKIVERSATLSPGGALAPFDYRFSTAFLIRGLDLSVDAHVEQIGEQLWTILHPGARGVPGDFEERHFLRNTDSLEVWSRAGAAFAFRDDENGHRRAKELQEDFGMIIEVLHREPPGGSPTSDALLTHYERQLGDISSIRQKLAKARGSVALRSFVDAIGFHDTLATVRELLASQRGHQMARTTHKVLEELKGGQEKVELLETLIVTLYGVEMGHIIIEALARATGELFEVRALCLVGIFIVSVVWYGLRTRNEGAEKQAGRRFTILTFVPLLTLVLLSAGLLLTVPGIHEYYLSATGESYGQEQAGPREETPDDPVNPPAIRDHSADR
jgi:hypothetical protein